ncbi:MAG: hypothetical protein V1660_03660 [archaeon]
MEATRFSVQEIQKNFLASQSRKAYAFLEPENQQDFHVIPKHAVKLKEFFDE